jgi:hypothetical protein
VQSQNGIDRLGEAGRHRWAEQSAQQSIWKPLRHAAKKEWSWVDWMRFLFYRLRSNAPPTLFAATYLYGWIQLTVTFYPSSQAVMKTPLKYCHVSCFPTAFAALQKSSVGYSSHELQLAFEACDLHLEDLSTDCRKVTAVDKLQNPSTPKQQNLAQTFW